MGLYFLLIASGIIILGIYLFRRFIIGQESDPVQDDLDEIEYFKRNYLKTQILDQEGEDE